MKTVGYLRVSTVDQDVDKFRHDILKFANDRDFGKVHFVEEKVSGAKPWRKRKLKEVVDGLGTGRFPLAALVMPASVNDIRTVSMAGERMPAKSTYFYPKLLSGLVINPLE